MSSEVENADLVVVGGGPGGATLATLVAMRGHKVILVERERFPRYQIGESLLPATVHGICRILGVSDEILSAGFVRKNGAAFRWGTGSEPWIFGFSQAPLLRQAEADFAFQVERSKFDHILLRNAQRKGVDVREGCRAESLVVEDGRVTGVVVRDDGDRPSTLNARFVIDASGNGSRLYRHLGERAYSKFFRNVALFGYFENGGRLPSPNQGNILCEAFDKGWIWYIPLSMEAPTLTSVGAVIGTEHAALIQQDPDAAMRSFIEQCPKVKGLLTGAKRITEGQYGQYRVRKDWSYTTERFWSPGFALVGDAACFVDPVLSSGVHLSTYSGLLAARSVNSCLESEISEAAAFSEFERRYRLEFEMFYNFLISFYEMHHEPDSYFWEARKVLHTEERANEAFVRLVSGGSTAPEIYFDAKKGIGNALQQYASALDAQTPVDERGDVTHEMAEKLHSFGAHGEPRAPAHSGSDDLRRISWGQESSAVAMPMFEGGLIPSSDGLRWISAEPTGE